MGKSRERCGNTAWGLVRDNQMRVGKVVDGPTTVELDGNPVEVFDVDFWGTQMKRPDNWLTVLAPNSPRP